MKPEQQARRHIDALLTQAGWTVQEWPAFNLAAYAHGVEREDRHRDVWTMGTGQERSTDRPH